MLAGGLLSRSCRGPRCGNTLHAWHIRAGGDGGEASRAGPRPTKLPGELLVDVSKGHTTQGGYAATWRATSFAGSTDRPVGQGRLLRLPRPAVHQPESTLTVCVKGASGVQAALLNDPPPEPEAIDDVGRWDAGIAVVLDVFLETTEPLFPVVGVTPCPAVHRFESVLTVGLKAAFGAELALHHDPLAEREAIDDV